MVTTVEAVLGTDGVVRLLEPVAHPNEAALLSEPALADWDRAEEDAARAHLQPAK